MEVRNQQASASEDSVFIICDDRTQSWSLTLPQVVDEDKEDYSVQIDVKLGLASSFIEYSESNRQFSLKSPEEWSERPSTGVYVVEILLLDSRE